MQDSPLAVLISRLDFAWITTMHILYPPLTIGLAILLFLAEWRWVSTNNENWYRLVRFFEKLFIVNFGAGVATGITMEMAFGILYGPFSQAAGPFFGQVLGYETITAFMYEAGFIGLMIFGWGKISKRMHLFATFNVALGSTLSAMWILDANSWMQTPAGVVLKNGFFQIVDWGAALLNPDVLLGFPHMLVACFEIGLCFVTAISAWFILTGRHIPLFQKSLKCAVLALVVVAPLQIYLGDGLGRVVADDQPTALAALEGHYHTYNPDGSVNTGWHVVAWPNAAGDGAAWAITIPHVLSLLETHTWNGKVPGLDDFPPQNRPPMLIPFYAFRVMAGAGAAIMLLAFWGLWIALRRGFTVERVAQHRWFLRAAIACGFLPYIAVWTGWWVREVGRQPWVVYGLMRTADGVSHMGVAEASFWLVGYITFELSVWASVWYFLAKIMRQGPDIDSPIVHGGHQALGSLEGPNHDAAPSYVRPI
ncbi:cytochrome ubiquinol oxidase subunit I [Acidocella aminolytica]|uniref:Cytochrome bd ubiquinol oxidase subunit I n=1 Tax=Acidocella aminolytica 101 = DSM 11237 TaxID=1120923 RepID=A0A0D6PHF4_9PROT|nr:cytochrome ubiquinol oxidase subunit I [Acidocella aminolytica]GAN80628.1 cytochrome bd ubiquinol oxidase subunit I [Acidocella aminolytica 101 = DSM 11237]GBQ40183.1 cytochrome bd ubiquinol oxidase subunit I [Acidocella aminolytica 101 = DSM 11237]SHE55674.1 cytochrome d ubiquinol oxidase subunit I [Acidocella aminolytica 101 = DSM 11237]